MKPIKTQQRFRCDFCKKTGVKRTMLVHEKRCFRNPDRYCDFCDNKGFNIEIYEGIGTRKIDCPYCSQFNPKVLKENLPLNSCACGGLKIHESDYCKDCV